MLVATAATGTEAKVLRTTSGAPTVFVFKGTNELRQFTKLSGGNRDAVQPLIVCEVPQGSNVEVLGSGYRTAFVKVVEGVAFGCEGTVPIGYVRDR